MPARTLPLWTPMRVRNFFPRTSKLGQATQIAGRFGGADGMLGVGDRRAPGSHDRVPNVFDDRSALFQDATRGLAEIGSENGGCFRRIEILGDEW